MFFKKHGIKINTAEKFSCSVDILQEDDNKIVITRCHTKKYGERLFSFERNGWAFPVLPDCTSEPVAWDIHLVSVAFHGGVQVIK